MNLPSPASVLLAKRMLALSLAHSEQTDDREAAAQLYKELAAGTTAESGDIASLATLLCEAGRFDEAKAAVIDGIGRFPKQADRFAETGQAIVAATGDKDFRKRMEAALAREDHVTDERSSFKAGINFESVLRIISKQIYETPLAFIRENVQNAVDAIRIQAHRDGIGADDAQYRIDVTVQDKKITVRDNGVGMTAGDLENFFWTIGASGKRTQEALAAGCVGTFGIGGFANFGVCESLEVISQIKDTPHGTLTRLSEKDIRAADSTIPSVTREISDAAAPRGTLVVGQLREPANVDQVRVYLQDFVRFVPTAIYFNGQKVSQSRFSDIENRENLTPIGGTQTWQESDLSIMGRLYEDRGHNLVAAIAGLAVGGETVNLTGYIRFENGPVDVFKRGFKLCATQIGSTIGVSGGGVT